MPGTFLGTLAGGVVQAGLGALNNIWAQQQQREARRENYLYGEMAAENADARTRALYNDFYSTEALMKQYKAAGLSPSMMFGGTPGQGGTSGAQGTGAQGPGALFTPMSMIEGAQIGLLNAQAEKTKAETKTIEESREPTIENLFADLQKKFAETNNTKAETTLTKLQSNYQRIANTYAGQGFEANLKVAEAQTEVLAKQATLLVYQGLHEATEAELAEITKQDRAQQQQLINKNLLMDILTKNETMKLTKTQAEVIVKKVENETEMVWHDYKRMVVENVKNWSEIDFIERNNKFFDDRIKMWREDFEKDLYKFGEEMGIEKEKIEIMNKQLQETIRHNVQTESAMFLFGTLKAASGWGGF